MGMTPRICNITRLPIEDGDKVVFIELPKAYKKFETMMMIMEQDREFGGMMRDYMELARNNIKRIEEKLKEDLAPDIRSALEDEKSADEGRLKKGEDLFKPWRSYGLGIYDGYGGIGHTPVMSNTLLFHEKAFYRFTAFKGGIGNLPSVLDFLFENLFLCRLNPIYGNNYLGQQGLDADEVTARTLQAAAVEVVTTEKGFVE